jgi:hypothetical protein
MFTQAWVRRPRTAPLADYSKMKPALAHLSPTVPAAFATAIAISLSGFLLAGAGVQGEPAPLLPAVGSAAGRVIAQLPAAAHRRHVSEPVTRSAASPRLVATATHEFPRRRTVVAKPHRVHRAAPVARQAPRARVHVPARAPRPTPVTTRVFPKRPASTGKARGHGHSHARAPKPQAATGARVHGHGRALGHHHGFPPGQAKKAAAAPQPAPAATAKSHGGGPPADHGGGNGHDGGKK